MASDSPRVRIRRARSPQTRPGEILDAAMSLFRERGYAETSMRHIAQAADVAIGTVYLYYPSKDSVLAECHRRFRDGLAAHVGQAVLEPLRAGQDVDLRAALDTAAHAIADFARDNRELCEVTLTSAPAGAADAASQKISQVIAAVLEQARHRGLVHAPDPDVAALLLSRMLGYPICAAAVFGDPPLDRVLPIATDMAYRSLQPAQ